LLAKYEKRKYVSREHVWVGKYKNLHNISHWHMEHELIACQHGRADVMVNNDLFSIVQGQCIFCPSGSVHFINAEDDCILLVCLFEEKLDESITSEYTLSKPVFEDSYSALSRLTAIYEELHNQLPFFEEKTASMISELVADIFRNEPLEKASSNPSAALTRYKQLLNMIDKDYDSISFEDAARLMCLSEAYFSKYFKKQSGMTFSHYLNVVRIEKAVNFLKSDGSIKITDVMLKCGFNTIRNFNRTFKEITGFSPTHMPQGYTLYIRSLPTIQDDFDPTLKSSVLL
jgi:xylan 1,4-beta-xylosidase